MMTASCWICGIELKGQVVTCADCEALKFGLFREAQQITKLQERPLLSSDQEADLVMSRKMLGAGNGIVQRQINAYIFGWLCGIGRGDADLRVAPRDSRTSSTSAFEDPNLFLQYVTELEGLPINEVVSDKLIAPIMIRYGSERGEPILNRSVVWYGRWLECRGLRLKAIEAHFCASSHLDSSDKMQALRRFCLARLILQQVENCEEEFWELAQNHWPDWAPTIRESLRERVVYPPCRTLVYRGVHDVPALFDLLEKDAAFYSNVGKLVTRDVASHLMSNARGAIELDLLYIKTDLNNMSSSMRNLDAQSKSILAPLVLNRRHYNQRKEIYRETFDSSIRGQLISVSESDNYIVLRRGKTISGEALDWYASQYQRLFVSCMR